MVVIGQDPCTIVAQVAYLLLLSDNAKQLNLEAVNAERRWLTMTETLTQADSASPYCH